MAPLSALKRPKRGRAHAHADADADAGATPCPTENVPSNGCSCSDRPEPSAEVPPSDAMAPSPSKGPSVTLLSLEPLPSSYGGERSYLLSEIQEAARDMLLLDDDPTKATDNSKGCEPSFAVLYLQWHPRMPLAEVEQFLLYQTERARTRLAPAPQVPDLVDEPVAPHEPAAALAPSGPAHAGDDDDDSDGVRRACHLYVVVDRVDDASTTSEPEAAARALARRVATHTRLRQLIQGVTIGVANCTRLAPGLDACVQAFGVGSEDRYRFGSRASGLPTRSDTDTTRSLITIVATSSDTLLGWHPTLPANGDGGPDGAPAPPAPSSAPLGAVVVDGAPLAQFRVVAEWGGQGNLISFGQRAHAQWRRHRGLWAQPTCLGPARRPVPRLLPPLSVQRSLLNATNMNMASVMGSAPSPSDIPAAWKGYNPDVAWRRLRGYAMDALVLASLGFYLWFHFRDDMAQILHSPPSLLDLAQYLRAL